MTAAQQSLVLLAAHQGPTLDQICWQLMCDTRPSHYSPLTVLDLFVDSPLTPPHFSILLIAKCACACYVWDAECWSGCYRPRPLPDFSFPYYSRDGYVPLRCSASGCAFVLSMRLRKPAVIRCFGVLDVPGRSHISPVFRFSGRGTSL